MNLPNKLTMLRIIMIPVFIACFFLPADWVLLSINGVAVQYRYLFAALVFLLAYITDTIDGAIARKRNLVTDFGKLMDPTADKMLTSAALIMLCTHEVMSFGNSLMPVFSFIIIARELLISGVRQLAASKNIVIAASVAGKVKTTLQFAALLMVLLFGRLCFAVSIPVDFIVMCAAVITTIYSGIDYIIANKALLSEF